MSKQWEILFRIKQHKLDGKLHPPKEQIKTTMEGFLATFAPTYEFVKDSLKITNKTTGGAKNKASGSDYERRIAKMLEAWWGCPFRRTPNSGGWDKQSTDGEVMAVGDIISTDPDFPFAIECKHRKEALNLFSVQSDSSDMILDWWKQCKDDADTIKKAPLLIMSCGRTEYAMFLNYAQSEHTEPEHSRVLELMDKGLHYGYVMMLSDFLAHFGEANGKTGTTKTATDTSAEQFDC